MAKKHFSNKARRKKSHLLLWIVLVVIGVPALGVASIMATFDINAYRPMIEKAILDKTGREIALNGEIAWSLSLDHGFSLAINDVVVKNPSWASRPDMARIGTAKLHLDVIPLLQKKLNIIAFEISKTDVQFETNASGAVNWDFAPKAESKAAAPTQTDRAENERAAPPVTAPIAIDVREIAITDSRFGLKNKEGKLSVYDIPKLTLNGSGKNVNIHFNGTIEGAPLELDMTGGALHDLTGANWPFTLQALYNNLKLNAQGSLQDNLKKVTLAKFALEAGETKLDGAATILLGAARPSITGKIHSAKLNPSDLTVQSKTESPDEKPQESGKKTHEPAPDSSGKIFSREPLALDGLRAADLQLDVAIDTLVLGLSSIEQLKTRVDLQGGRLSLTPLTGRVAGSAVEANLKLDASGPEAKLTKSLKAPALDLSQLFKLGGLESAISGKSAIDINLTTYGRSTYDFAAHANGTINVLMDAGQISSSQLKEIAGALLDLFAPGIGGLASPGINCMAARYVITNGLMDTKGLLIDTDVTTIAGKGFINLPDEKIGMSLFTRPKAVGISSMIPPTRISGDLAKPSFTLDAAGAVEKLTNLLMKNGTTADGVPTLVTAAGKNTCAATLDNPNAAPPKSSTGPASVILPGKVEELKSKAKDLGGSLLKGLMGN